MIHALKNLVVIPVLCAVMLVLSAQQSFAAAGAPPGGPLEAPKTGADLKHACGQTVDGFDGREGERTLREMLITQCRATVSAIVEMVEGGQYMIGEREVWKCVENRTDEAALAETFVKWVGRRPQLMRMPAAVAFVEAVEMSAKCRN